MNCWLPTVFTYPADVGITAIKLLGLTKAQDTVVLAVEVFVVPLKTGSLSIIGFNSLTREFISP
jgi:hypothetical protein